ncbi:MAG TPA: Ig-like domain-containing protein [Gemmatimonadales bacterium]|nr:Ig-like domain-containing protein [Gemmatimonadales bacterium]
MLVDSAEAIAISRGVMGAGGCAPVIGRPPAGAVWVVLPQAPPQQFDCGQLSADSAQRLARAARTSVRSTGSGAHAYSDPGYWEITTEEVHSCSSTVPVSWSEPAMGTAHWIKVTLPDGETWEFWVEPGVTVAVRFVTCSWVEKISARKFDGGGTPLIPAPGEFPNPDGGGGPSQYPTNEPQLVSVAVTPGERTLPVGEIAQFQATLTYNNGAVVESAANVIWSSNSAIAVVDDYGTFQVTEVGAATITARLGSAVSPGATLLSEPMDADPESDEVDYLEDVEDPNCLLVGSLPDWMNWRNRSYQRAWCRGAVPNSTELPVVQAAVARIRAKGGSCTAIADSLAIMLANDKIRLFDRNANERFGGVGTRNGTNVAAAWMILERRWVTRHSTATEATVPSTGEPFRRTLQTSLVHEMEHILGIPHSDGERTAPGVGGYLTPNMYACGDVQ